MKTSDAQDKSGARAQFERKRDQILHYGRCLDRFEQRAVKFRLQGKGIGGDGKFLQLEVLAKEFDSARCALSAVEKARDVEEYQSRLIRFLEAYALVREGLQKMQLIDRNRGTAELN